jgi:molybdopterin synthase catalytic subunit
MSVQCHLVSRPIRESDWEMTPREEEGAQVRFLGTVRSLEAGTPIRALEYEAYAPMAEKELQRIGREVLALHGAIRLAVVHRLGEVPVGEAAVAIGVTAAHRQAAITCLGDFLDRMKSTVPIWKCRTLS